MHGIGYMREETVPSKKMMSSIVCDARFFINTILKYTALRAVWNATIHTLWKISVPLVFGGTMSKRGSVGVVYKFLAST